MFGKIMITAAAIVLFILGVLLNFIPDESASIMGMGEDEALAFSLQIDAGLSLGLGLLNWMTRRAAIGGIYNKPLVLANTLSFVVIALALYRGLSSGLLSRVMWAPFFVMALLAIGFAYLAFLYSPKAPARTVDAAE